jgi:hypothetical protein
MVLEQVGLQGLLVKPALTPTGRPLPERTTSVATPETRVRVIVVEPEAPWATVMLPLLVKV